MSAPIKHYECDANGFMIESETGDWLKREYVIALVNAKIETARKAGNVADYSRGLKEIRDAL